MGGDWPAGCRVVRRNYPRSDKHPLGIVKQRMKFRSTREALVGLLSGGFIGTIVWLLYPPAVVGVVVGGALIGFHAVVVFRDGISTGTIVQTVLILVILGGVAVAGTGIQPVDARAEDAAGWMLMNGAASVEGDLLGDTRGPTKVPTTSSPVRDPNLDAADGRTSVNRSINVTALEREIHRAVNERRAERGEPRLAFDPSLRGIAANYSKRMHDEQFFSHIAPSGQTFQDRYLDAGYYCAAMRWSTPYTVIGGENLFYYQVRNDTSTGTRSLEARLAQITVAAWMDSPPHRNALLRPIWDDEGIGVYRSDDELYVTQNFC